MGTDVHAPPESDPPARQAPELRPPGRPPEAPGRGRSTRRTLLVLAGALGLGLATVYLLPSLVERGAGGGASGTPAPERPVAQSAPGTGAARTAQRAAAEDALRGYLRQRAEAESIGAGRWAVGDLSNAADEATAGDRSFAQRRFAEAEERYNSASARLEALIASRPDRLSAALQAGREALAADAPRRAATQFALALELEPGLEEAERGLARAEARPAVLERMAEGRVAELAGDLVNAEAAYRDAVALDPEHAPAVAAADRVAARRAERAFGEAMSRALAALDVGRLGEAREALDSAARLRPADRAVVDARRRLVEARRGSELVRLREAAETQAAAEAWDAAEKLYLAALAIDPAAAFASAGVERARHRARLNARIDHYLADPTRLYAPEPLAEAERLLAASASITEGEPGLAAKAERLTARVLEARTPRSVTLRSDGLTEVTVYHVGRLGAFAERRLELRPGQYTALGARPGHRDTRVSFTVLPDAPPPSVTVVAGEPL